MRKLDAATRREAEELCFERARLSAAADAANATEKTSGFSLCGMI
jgi:hypothetical protein